MFHLFQSDSPWQQLRLVRLMVAVIPWVDVEVSADITDRTCTVFTNRTCAVFTNRKCAVFTDRMCAVFTNRKCAVFTDIA